MNSERTVFAQLMAHAPIRNSRNAQPDRKALLYQDVSCWDRYLAVAFAQFTYLESLRQIEARLLSMRAKFFYMGFRTLTPRHTLAEANEIRDWRIFADFIQDLIAIARPIYTTDPLAIDLDQPHYALDSTTIDLCLSLFP